MAHCLYGTGCNSLAHIPAMQPGSCSKLKLLTLQFAQKDSCCKHGCVVCIAACHW
jgi:hypothetical protein